MRQDIQGRSIKSAKMGGWKDKITPEEFQKRLEAVNESHLLRLANESTMASKMRGFRINRIRPSRGYRRVMES